jgi:RNA polymerase primary sigma factor
MRAGAGSGRVRDDGSALALYLEEIRGIPLLSRQEEEELARRAARGDRAAREKLARANLRFVVSIAKKYRNRGVPFADLISEGNIGLLLAVERFDMRKGYRFISYAVWWIRQSIRKAVCRQARLIRLPMDKANALLRIERVRGELEGEGRPSFGAAAIAGRMDLDEAYVAELLFLSRDPLSMDMPVSADRDSACLGDLIGDRETEGPMDGAIRACLREDVDTAIATLGGRESDVLRSHLGLDGRPQTLREIGVRHGLSKERIRQIEKRAISRLSRSSRDGPLAAYGEIPLPAGSS